MGLDGVDACPAPRDPMKHFFSARGSSMISTGGSSTWCCLPAPFRSLALGPAFPTRGPELPEGLGCSTHGRGRALP
eukprot:14409486-Alexandrium_andersonii.AAC.1